jgi:LysM repeat protein
MKGTNPIIPPGMNFEGAKRGRSNMRMAVIVVVLLHIALFTGILFNACKQKDEEASEGARKSDTLKTAQIIASQPEPDSQPGPASLPQLPLPTESLLPALPEGSGLPPLPSEAGSTLPPAPTPALSSNPLELPTIPLTAPSIVATGTEHVVASGESFWNISKKYGVSVRSIEKANPKVIPTRMKIGQKIAIPPKAIAEPTSASSVVNDGSTYTVKSGDTLGHIALRHRVELKDLKAANPNVVPTRMKIGQQLKMPAGVATSPQAVAPSLPVFSSPDTTVSPPVDPTTGLPLPVGTNR